MPWHWLQAAGTNYVNVLSFTELFKVLSDMRLFTKLWFNLDFTSQRETSFQEERPIKPSVIWIVPKKLIFMSKPKHFVKWQLLKVFGGARTSWFLLWNILRNMLWKTHWPLEMLLLPSLKSSSIYYFDVIQKRTCQVKLNDSVALMDCSAAVFSFTCSHIALGCSWV